VFPEHNDDKKQHYFLAFVQQHTNAAMMDSRI
jgi:hypothetical protein